MLYFSSLFWWTIVYVRGKCRVYLEMKSVIAYVNIHAKKVYSNIIYKLDTLLCIVCCIQTFENFLYTDAETTFGKHQKYLKANERARDRESEYNK